ncbi:MAG TPA: hypothetical protein VFX53_17600 [Pedococcus sp.]|nr:hypothetical protein [Pedococcus sp.]
MKLYRRRGWFSRWLDRRIPAVEGDISLLDRTDGVGLAAGEHQRAHADVVSEDGRATVSPEARPRGR